MSTLAAAPFTVAIKHLGVDSETFRGLVEGGRIRAFQTRDGTRYDVTGCREEADRPVTIQEALAVIEPFFAVPVPRTKSNPNGEGAAHVLECIEHLRILRDRLRAMEKNAKST